MSRDIRSFFTKSPKNAGSSRKPESKPTVIRLSSDEDETKVKSSEKLRKVSKKSSRRHVLSDSEDEAPIPKKKNEKIVKEETKEEKLKPVAVSDIFGKKSISRVNAPTVSKKYPKKETDFHNDDEFDATLIDLDMSDLESKSLTSGPMDDTNNSKRKHSGESDDDVKAKKVRRNGSSVEKKREEKRSNHEKERKASSGDENKKKSRKTEATDSKSVKRENSTDRKMDKKYESNVAKTSSTSDKLKKNKNTIEIVMEPKKEKQNKKAREKEASHQYAEGIEKKKERAVLYNQYLHRGGARNPGSKPIPKGARNCLAGLTFVITGVLDSLERDESEDLIKQYGGRVMSAISKKTDYLVVGDDAGPSKLSKATSFGTKQISEDELLDLIRTRPAGNSKDIIQPRKHSNSRKRSRSPETILISPDLKRPNSAAKPATDVEVIELPSTSVQKLETKIANSSSTSENTLKPMDDAKVLGALDPGQALVDKYRPKNMKQIIGQHGEKSNANKLYNWLRNWYKNQSGDVKLTKPSPWAQNDDGAFFKACLLSGPPGIGKTTTAQVVCSELEFDLLEFNASDTRSKRLLKEEVSGILSNTTVKGYFTDNSAHKLSKKHVLLMDEVDGMAGNEDRGGLQELIALIKSSEIPIICICNDRNHPKMRTLANYTFDLRFSKPRLENIRGAMKTLCYKEKIDISSVDLDRLILSTNQDIRQIINHLAMLRSGSASQEKAKEKQMNKDLRLGPWDVIQKVFSAEEHMKMNIHDKSNLFFHDYNIAPLFVQENYLSVQPKAPKEQLLMRVARAADSLAMGDVIENAIRGNGAWSLLPTQACFSSVIPGSIMSGRMTGRANFPAWLGRNSKRGKFDRLLQEITVHARLATGASKEAINIDYLNPLRDAIVRPLALHKNEGIDEALNVMNHYHFLREDLESLIEVSLWPGQQDPMQAIESKVKAAFTRAYNKLSAPAPYLMNVAAPKKKTVQASQDEGFMEGEDEEDDVVSDTDNDDMSLDRMIKAKKATASDNTAKSSKTEAKPKAKRGRGRGKAK